MGDLTNENTIFLDYVSSDDPAEIDQGIRDTIKGVRLSVLTIGLGLARIKSEKLFKKLNSRNITEYLERLCDETKMVRSTIYNWLDIGEAYIKYRTELEQIGFSDQDGPTKLPYLERALAVREKDEVFDNIRNMSLREFIEFSKGERAEPSEDTPYIVIKGSVVYIKGRRAIIVSNKIGRKITKYFLKVIHVACQALDKGGRIMPVFLRNKRESERFKRAYASIMAEVRKEERVK